MCLTYFASSRPTASEGEQSTTTSNICIVRQSTNQIRATQSFRFQSNVFQSSGNAGNRVTKKKVAPFRLPETISLTMITSWSSKVRRWNCERTRQSAFLFRRARVRSLLMSASSFPPERTPSIGTTTAGESVKRSACMIACQLCLAQRRCDGDMGDRRPSQQTHYLRPTLIEYTWRAAAVSSKTTLYYNFKYKRRLIGATVTE